MIVSVGEVAARCRSCGGTDFTPAQPAQVRTLTRPRGPGCGAAATYEELLDAIGEEAIRRANRSLDELKKKTPRPRKPRR